MIADMGQNFAGKVRLRVAGNTGTHFILRYAEELTKDGEHVDQTHLRCFVKEGEFQTEHYIKGTDSIETWTSHFTYHGFRYVLVETKIPFKAENFTAIAVYSEMERTGWFESSNPLLDKFVENTVWSAKNNHADLPTDCPTRERHGWSGDAQIFCPTACFLFDYEPMAEKFLNDMYDWQRKSGCLPQIAPSGGTDFYMYTMNGSVGWADAGVIMPYVLWKQYGDKQILARRYSGMKRYAQFMMRRCGRWGGPYAKPVHIPVLPLKSAGKRHKPPRAYRYSGTHRLKSFDSVNHTDTLSTDFQFH